MPKLKRPTRTTGPITKIPTGCGNLYIAVGYTEEKVPIEVFVTLGKAGGCAACHNEALGRVISLGLKYQIPVAEIVDQLSGLSCPSVAWDDGSRITSCADAIAQALKYSPYSDKPQTTSSTLPQVVRTCANCKHSRVGMWNGNTREIEIKSELDACLLLRKQINYVSPACEKWEQKTKPINLTPDKNITSPPMGPASDHYLKSAQPTKQKSQICPDCGSELMTEEGCLKCSQCGWTKC